MTPESAVVGLVQMSPVEDSRVNLAEALERVREAAASGAQIVCLPELFRSLYFCQEENPANFELAEPIPGPTTRALAETARRLEIVIVGSLFERRAAGIYHNSAIVIDADGRTAGLYRKMHIPDDPLYYEKFYFAPGDLGVRAFKTRYGRIAPLICWDQWYPEAARLAVLAGADLLVYPTAIGWHPAEKEDDGARQLDAWQTVQRAHAITNGVFVAAVNRVGLETPLAASASRPRDYRGIEFWGRSFVRGPRGEMLAEAGGEEGIVLARCDFPLIETARRDWPFLRDRRVDAYQGLSERFLDAEPIGRLAEQERGKR